MGIQILTQTLSSAEIASLSLLRTSHYCKSSHPKQGQNKSNLHILTATRVSQRMGSKEFIKKHFTCTYGPHFLLYIDITEDGRSMATFYYCSVNHQSGLQSNIFKIIIYSFNTSKCAANYVISFELYDGFISQDFEVMKAGKLAIWPWMSCPYNKHTLVDLPSSMGSTK